MKATVTGPDSLRAGLPKDWAIGHKTGTGEDGPTNDLAIAWPPGRAPVIITTFYDRTGHTMEQNAAVLAEVGRLATRSL
jgi:beta-lactamase class A